MVRKYSYEFKKYLVTLLESGLISANELARRHNIHKGVVCKIYNRYKQFGDKSLQHGQAAKTNMSECLMCHEERSECIACHEDTAPRSHTVTFVNKTHGLEARWNRTTCQTCHKQDFCDSCHETAYPMSHARANFASGVQTDPGSHCGTSCVIPVGNWSNTPAKNCIVCHKTRPMTKAGVLHTMK